MKMDRKWLRAVWQAGLALSLAFVVALLINQARQDTLLLVMNWSPEAMLTTDKGEGMVISLEQARELCEEKKALFLDARSQEDYVRGHIRCALNIPWQSFDQHIGRILETIPDHAWIVTYCDGENCSLSEELAKELYAMGYNHVKVLLNGWTRWVEAGFPVEEGRPTTASWGKNRNG